LKQKTIAIQQRFEEGRKANLMKRFGTVQDVANATMFYASPLSSYVSGTTLYVDGLEHLSGDRMGLLETLRSFL
jgi:NAD(P)-dependent dehydrogenase (short-subunit alcohol dehydrogenase family)